MATITTNDRPTGAGGDQRVVIGGVGWDGYRAILRLKGERRYPKIVYLDGSVVFVSPSPLHEMWAERLGRFVTEVMVGLAIPHLVTRSTTFRRRRKKGGSEADQSYYLTNLDRIRGKRKIDLRTDPPPDLAIEVVVSHDADDAVEVWRRFGVREVWVCDEDRLTILSLGADGRYAASDRSTAFPALQAEEIHAWILLETDDELVWLLELRRWVAEVLVPRGRALAAAPPPPKD